MVETPLSLPFPDVSHEILYYNNCHELLKKESKTKTETGRENYRDRDRVTESQK